VGVTLEILGVRRVIIVGDSMIAGATLVVLVGMTVVGEILAMVVIPEVLVVMTGMIEVDEIHVAVVDIHAVRVVMTEMIAGATHVVLAEMTAPQGVTTVADVIHVTADIPEVHVVMTEAEDLVVLVEMIAVVRPSEDVLTPMVRLSMVTSLKSVV
jgi:hypothetical protein